MQLLPSIFLYKCYTNDGVIINDSVVCLSEPSVGISQAFELAVEKPICSLSCQMAQSQLVNDFMCKGLFHYLVAHSEMSSFYELLLKKQQEISGERQLSCRVYERTLTSAGSGRTKETNKKKFRKVLTESCSLLENLHSGSHF